MVGQAGIEPATNPLWGDCYYHWATDPIKDAKYTAIHLTLIIIGFVPNPGISYLLVSTFTLDFAFLTDIAFATAIFSIR